MAGASPAMTVGGLTSVAHWGKGGIITDVSRDERRMNAVLRAYVHDRKRKRRA